MLSGIAEELSGRPLGFRTVAEARSEMEEIGRGTATAPTLARRSRRARPPRSDRTTWLATWKQMLDNGSLQDGDAALRATARRAVARVPAALADALGRDGHPHR